MKEENQLLLEREKLKQVIQKLEEEEKNTFEDFGYWCRQIPNS